MHPLIINFLTKGNRFVRDESFYAAYLKHFAVLMLLIKRSTYL